MGLRLSISIHSDVCLVTNKYSASKADINNHILEFLYTTKERQLLNSITQHSLELIIAYHGHHTSFCKPYNHHPDAVCKPSSHVSLNNAIVNVLSVQNFNPLIEKALNYLFDTISCKKSMVDYGGSVGLPEALVRLLIVNQNNHILLVKTCDMIMKLLRQGYCIFLYSVKQRFQSAGILLIYLCFSLIFFAALLLPIS